MVRTQVQLTEEQYRGLKRWAQRLGISLSEAVRRFVAEGLAREEGTPTYEERVRAALSVVGKYTDPQGLTDVATDHDRYLEEAYRS